MKDLRNNKGGSSSGPGENVYSKEEVELFTKEQLLLLTWTELRNWIKNLPQLTNEKFMLLDYEMEKFD